MNQEMAAIVFVTDALVTFFGWQRMDGWLTGRKLHTVLWDAALTAAIGINTIGYVEAKWYMLAPSLLGSALGTLASFKWRLW
jgi:hypothetical protein